ncbi:hypothetical protein HF521_020081 [Silurus meridionalis]|uniref:Uncharacterized protein n=1 Tax=Silurus meridionalis TaxID=175797 RepID=A0A8T0BMM0_SILME|nr:hypothetical protein HF521_020081 [Silurus meridionalis]
MVERFLEQFPATQDTSMDPQLKKSVKKDRKGQSSLPLRSCLVVEDMAVGPLCVGWTSVSSTTEKIQAEINQYRRLPSTLSSVSPETWWWDMKNTANDFRFGNKASLCAGVIHTLRAYMFHSWGQNQSACLSPEKADMLIFL